VFLALVLLPCCPSSNKPSRPATAPSHPHAQNPRRGTSLTESLPGFYFPVFCRLQFDGQKFPILPHGLVELSDSAMSLFSGNLRHWKSPTSIAMHTQWHQAYSQYSQHWKTPFPLLCTQCSIIHRWWIAALHYISTIGRPTALKYPPVHCHLLQAQAFCHSTRQPTAFLRWQIQYSLVG